MARDVGGAVSDYSGEGVAALLMLVGAVLFLFQEPSTSLVGVLLVLVGALTWLVDWVW